MKYTVYYVKDGVRPNQLQGEIKLIYLHEANALYLCLLAITNHIATLSIEENVTIYIHKKTEDFGIVCVTTIHHFPSF